MKFVPLTPSATRALLDQLGHRPRKQLGQNFLVDGNIVRKSLELAAIAPGERVVEVGPGLGTLTSALLAAGAEVFAIERDPVLLAHLQATLVPAAAGKLHLSEGDAVEQPLAGLVAAAGAHPAISAGDEPAAAGPTLGGGAFKIVANLPYAISSPWMEAVLAGPLPERMVLMLQLEAAQRYAAEPGTKLFGAISVFLQAAFEIARGHRVARTCFHPVPDVDSTLMNLRRRGAPYAFSAAGRELIRAVFQQRRKQLAPLLRRTAPAAVVETWVRELTSAGGRADARPEDVAVKFWIRLDQLLQKAKGAG